MFMLKPGRNAGWATKPITVVSDSSGVSAVLPMAPVSALTAWRFRCGSVTVEVPWLEPW